MRLQGALAPLVALLIPIAAPLTAAEMEPAIVEVATVTRGDSSSILRLPGTVTSLQDAQISAEVTGRLTWVAEVGEPIAKGGVMATLDDHLLQLQLRDDAAEIARLSADIDYNERQIARLQRLAEQNNTSQSGLEEVQSRHEMLLQEKRIAEVARDRTLYDLSRTRVEAPFSGVVVSREANVGEYKETGDPLLRLVNTESLEISVNAPLRTARFNPAKSQVTVEGNDHSVTTEIRALIPVGDALSRMMEFRLQLEPGHWQIGEAVTVMLLDSPSVDSLSVPRDALVLRDDEVFIYTVSADNRAIKVPVTTRAGQGSRISIDGAIEPGALVVIRGAERLQDGQVVRIRSRQEENTTAGV
ncbi:MAG: efflux RND transporter periplasmic adaptor subunit [Pseudomonadota bacterium]